MRNSFAIAQIAAWGDALPLRAKWGRHDSSCRDLVRIGWSRFPLSSSALAHRGDARFEIFSTAQPEAQRFESSHSAFDHR